MTVITTLKALHILGFVIWFGGLTQLAALLLSDKEERVDAGGDGNGILGYLREKQSRVYRQVANPGMMLTWTAGIIMLILNPAYLSTDYGTPGWMHLKLTLLVLLLLYHLYLKRVMKRMQAGKSSFSRVRIKMLGMIPLIFLVAIVFLAVQGKAGLLNYGSWSGGILLLILISYGWSRNGK
jgi:putative membrane protein